MDVDWLFKYAVIVVGLFCATVGFIIGYAEGVKHRAKLKNCTDCGDKLDTLCHDCRFKLNGEMAEGL